MVEFERLFLRNDKFESKRVYGYFSFFSVSENLSFSVFLMSLILLLLYSTTFSSDFLKRLLPLSFDIFAHYLVELNNLFLTEENLSSRAFDASFCLDLNSVNFYPRASLTSSIFSWLYLTTFYYVFFIESFVSFTFGFIF